MLRNRYVKVFFLAIFLLGLGLTGCRIIGNYPDEGDVNSEGEGSASVTGAILLPVDTPIQIPIFSLTFDPQGGSAVVVQRVEQQARAKEPAVPTRGGYPFAGWYKEAGCINME